MTVSIILPTAGSRPRYLRDAVASLCTQTVKDFSYEVIVVENGKTSKLTRAEVFPADTKVETQLLHESKVGAAWARHKGYRESKGEILVFVDDDILVAPDWLQTLVRSYSDPKVGCTGGKVILELEVPPPSWWRDDFNEGHLAKLDYGDERTFLAWPRCVWSCNMSVRRSVFEAVGGFNPDFSADPGELWRTGDNECGLEWKIWQKGYEIFYEPDASVRHRIPADRLTPDYFCRRNFIEGVMESYTDVRMMQGQSAVPLRLVLASIYCFAMSARKRLLYYFKKRYRLRTRAHIFRWYGKAMHKWQAARSKDLRKYIWQESYLRY